MKWFKNISKDNLLYGGFIYTFAILYLATAFVSWYHAITFFNIANAVWLSVILSFVAEIGQASVLFNILMTKMKQKFLPWIVMIILTTLQVIGNVDSSYDWIVKHNDAGLESFQKSILFWLQAADQDTFRIVVAWISGALLPIIALSLTALVAQVLEMRAHEAKTALDNQEIKPIEKEFNTKEEPIESTDESTDSNVDSFLTTAETVINQHKPKTREEIIADIQKEEEKLAAEEKEEKEKLDDEINKKISQKVEEQIEQMRRLMTLPKVDIDVLPTKIKDVLAPGVKDYDNEIKTDETLQGNIEETVEDFNRRIQPQTELSTDIFVNDKIDLPFKMEKEGISDPELQKATEEATEAMYEKDDLDKEVEYYLPEDGPTGTSGHPDPSGIRLDEPPVKHENGLVQGMGEISPTVTEERLEKIRRLAKEQEDLKKK